MLGLQILQNMVLGKTKVLYFIRNTKERIQSK